MAMVSCINAQVADTSGPNGRCVLEFSEVIMFVSSYWIKIVDLRIYL